MRSVTLPTSFLALLLGSAICYAWERPTFEDATVVKRSELIVVGRLKPDVVRHIPHKKQPGEGTSWESHAVLVITQVLKGKCDQAEIPIVIHYGLEPITAKAGLPKGIIEIHDVGGTNPLRFGSLVPEATEDNLWFLRKRSGTLGREPGNGNYGIVDPEDLQPIKWKEFIQCYLTEDPERALKELVWKDPELADRAKSYFYHLEVQRAVTLADARQRFDRLLPFFLNRTTWEMREEARDGIVACGAVGGERLLQVFADPTHKHLRHVIMRMWQEMCYREVVPLLINLLEEHDAFWGKQTFEKGWWGDQTNPELTARRQEVFGEIVDAVRTLGELRDPRAKDAIELTKRRWTLAFYDSPQIVEECITARRRLNEAGPPGTSKGPAGDR
jgi:hypothetical protein